MIADEPDAELSPEQIAAELRGAGIGLTKLDLAAMIAAAKAGAEAKAAAGAREVRLFPLKPMLPSHVSYEVGRRACASGELRAEKHGGDWFTTKSDVTEWLTSTGKWFKSETAVADWLSDIAQLDRWWIG